MVQLGTPSRYTGYRMKGTPGFSNNASWKGGGRRQPPSPRHARPHTAHSSGGACCGDGDDADGPAPTPHATRAHTESRERGPSWPGGWYRIAERAGEHHPVRG